VTQYGAFVDIGAGFPNVVGSAPAWGDYDNDGDLDLAVTGVNGAAGLTRLYRNSGGPAPTFTDAAAGLVGMAYSAVSFCDYDLDGDLDILLTGSPGGGAPPQLILYRNSGGADPTFTGIPTGVSGVIQGSMSWGDYDADGDPDLALSGQDGGTVNRTRILRNSGGANPTFLDIGAPLTGVSAGTVAWGDYDNDGDLDLLVAGNDGSAPTSRMFMNGGGANPAFTATGETLPGVFYGAAVFGDLDRDHSLDIAISGLQGPPFGFAMEHNACRPLNTPPAPPTGLSVSLNGNQATFSWNAATDTQTPPAALTYELRIGTTPGGIDVLAPAAALNNGVRRVAARGNVGECTSHTLVLNAQGPWYWSVQAVDASYEGSFFAPEQAITQLGVADEAAPTAIALWSAGPNPFSAATSIGFSVTAPGPVSLTIFDPSGRRVRRLVEDEVDSGRFLRTWDGRDDRGLERPAGLYFARLQTGITSRVLRLIRVR